MDSEIRTVNIVVPLTIAVIGTTGNALSIGLICRAGADGELQQAAAPILALLVGLCSANLVTSALLMPGAAVTNLQGRWLLGSLSCRLFGYAIYVTVTAESLLLFALTVTQYAVVVHRVMPARIRRALPVLLTTPWFVAGLLYLPTLMGTWERFAYDPRKGYCTLVPGELDLSDNSDCPNTPRFLVLVACVFASFLTGSTVYCYSAIVYTTYRSRRRTGTVCKSLTLSNKTRTKVAAIAMFNVVPKVSSIPLNVEDAGESSDTGGDMVHRANVTESETEKKAPITTAAKSEHEKLKPYTDTDIFKENNSKDNFSTGAIHSTKASPSPLTTKATKTIYKTKVSAPTSDIYKGRRSRELHLLRMTTLVLVNYAVTYLPFLVLVASDPCLVNTSPMLYTVVTYLSWSHSATNPLIYALSNTNISRRFFSCRSDQQQQHKKPQLHRGKDKAAPIT